MKIDENKSKEQRYRSKKKKKNDVLFNGTMINYFFPFHICLLLSLIFSSRIRVKSYCHLQNRIKNNVNTLDV